MILFNLFMVFFRVSLFAIGGADSFLPLIEKEVVERSHWLTREEFLDVLGIVKVLPGAISIKYATYTGYKIAGIPGVVFANLGNLLVPVLLVAFAFALYAKYKNLSGVKQAFGAIQLAVFAMIVALAFKLIDVGQLLQLKNLLIILISFVLFIYTRIHPALILVCAGILGIFLK